MEIIHHNRDFMKNTAKFTGLSFAMSWLVLVVFLLAGGKWNSVYAQIVAVVYMYMPFIAALILHKGNNWKDLQRDFGISFKINKWFFVAWLIMPVLAILTFALTLVFPGIEFSPDMAGLIERYERFLSPEKVAEARQQFEQMPFHPFWLTLISSLFMGLTINTIAAFGEEAGWRGYLFHLFRNKSFWFTALVTGAIWGVWHAPVIALGHNYPQHPYQGILMMFLWCIVLSPLFVYIRLKSKSVIAVSILHGTLNASAGLAILMIKGGDDITTGITGIPGFVVLLFTVSVFWLYDKYITKENIMSNVIGKYMPVVEDVQPDDNPECDNIKT